MNMLDISMYPSSTIGRLVGLNPTRVRRWLKGYHYSYSPRFLEEQHIVHQEPVLRRGTKEISTYASFLELIDLLFVKKFLDAGVSLQKIRKALIEAEGLIGEAHFAKSRFFTDGSKIYLQIKDKDNEAPNLLELLSGGQWVIAPIILELANQIDFDKSTEFASRWYPFGPSGLIALDPNISFGKPHIIHRGIATANVHDLYLGENKKVNRVCKWMGLNSNEVEAAIRFEERLIAA
ncbi:MAG: hypothetical protein JXQ30_12925 [Spirochaetes bacterium]|nr:hypothetical protein [Spirochaetota bacterium]